MELLEQIKRDFACKEQDIRAYSPLTLAYIGDAVYEVVIRTVLVERANEAVSKLNRKAVQYVRAGAQSAMIEALLPELTEEEIAVYGRGRNAKPHSLAKNADPADYHRATGFEALTGYLYLTGRTERMLELIRRGIERAGLAI